MNPPTNPWHRVRAGLHRLCGRAWFGMRRLDRSRRHFERVLALLGGDFAAHVYLARIAFLAGDYPGWRRELRQAYLLDPTRFAAMADAMTRREDLGPQLAGTGVDSQLPGTGPSVPWPRPNTTSPDMKAASRQLREIHDELQVLKRDLDNPRTEEVVKDLLSIMGAKNGDDCADGKERDRFAELGPITTQELRACDLDALARRFGDDAKSA